MANYSTTKALLLRGYSGLGSSTPGALDEIIETIIQQASAIKELNERVMNLERK